MSPPSGMTRLTPYDLSYLSKWRAPLMALFQAKKNLVCFDVLSSAQRNLAILATYSNKQQTVFKIAPVSTGSLQTEILCLTNLVHPNIVALKEGWTNSGHVFLELESVPGRCVADMLVENGRLSERKTRQIFSSIISGLSFLHSKGWVHRDVKPDNVIFDPITGHGKLIDFELATRFEKGLKLTAVVGSLRYLSPEMRRRSYEGPEADAWACGVTLFVLLCAHFPFSDEELISQTDSKRELMMLDVSPEGNDLMKGLLNPDASRRLTIDQTLNHSWLKKESKHRNIPIF